MNFWIILLVALVLAVGLVVVVIAGSATGKDDEEGYDVSDDPGDAHFDPLTGKKM